MREKKAKAHSEDTTIGFAACSLEGGSTVHTEKSQQEKNLCAGERNPQARAVEIIPDTTNRRQENPQTKAGREN